MNLYSTFLTRNVVIDDQEGSLIRGVIFDLGMTLLQFTGGWDEVIEQGNRDLEQYLARHEISVPGLMDSFRARLDENRQTRLKDHVERPTARLLQDVLIQFGLPILDEQSLDGAMKAFYRSSEEKWVLGRNAHSVLNELQSSGYRLGLLSNAGDANNVKRLLARTDLGKHFDVTVISASEGLRKPDVRVFKNISMYWQFPESTIVMVGDSLLQDIHGAQLAGMHQIWFYGNINKDEAQVEAEWVKPELSAANLAEVPVLIEQLGKGVDSSNA